MIDILRRQPHRFGAVNMHHAGVKRTRVASALSESTSVVNILWLEPPKINSIGVWQLIIGVPNSGSSL